MNRLLTVIIIRKLGPGQKGDPLQFTVLGSPASAGNKADLVLVKIFKKCNQMKSEVMQSFFKKLNFKIKTSKCYFERPMTQF